MPLSSKNQEHYTETVIRSLCIYRQHPQLNPISLLNKQPALLESAYPEAAITDASLDMW